MKGLIRKLMATTVVAASLTLHSQYALAAAPVVTVAPKSTQVATNPPKGTQASTSVPKSTQAATATPKSTQVATSAPTSAPVVKTTTTPLPVGTTPATRTNTPVVATVVSTPGTPSVTGTPAPQSSATASLATATTAIPTPSSGPGQRQATLAPTIAGSPMRLASPIAAITPVGSATPMRVTAISPPIVRNIQDNALAISGSGFVDGVTLAIGEKLLTNVKVQSSTAMTATMPSGLCPGAYDVTIMDPAGKSMVGGSQLVVQGVRQATLGEWTAAPAIGMARKAQTFTIELPTIEIVDTTCDKADWQLDVTLGAFSPFDDGKGALPLRSLRLEGSGGSRSGSAALAVADGSTRGTLTVPHAAGQTSASLRPLISADVPSHGYAGQYRMTVAVSLAGDAPDEGTRPPGGHR